MLTLPQSSAPHPIFCGNSIDTQDPSSYTPPVKKEVLVNDKTKIGRLIAWGGEHFVYEYDTDSVIKFSILYFFLGSKAKEKATRNPPPTFGWTGFSYFWDSFCSFLVGLSA